MNNIPISFSLPVFPTGFAGTQEDFKSFFVAYLRADITYAYALSGRIGGVAPTADIGPWADRQSWKTWSTVAGKYLYNTFAVGNENYVVRVDGAPTVNRTLLIQDKSGIAALTDDLYIPRQTFPLTGVHVIVDWNASDTFYHELTGNTDYTMVNSRHGQEIYLAVMNPGNATVDFPPTVGFIGGVQPVQTKHLASGTLTDVKVWSGSKLAYSASAGFTGTEKGLTFTQAGNTNIPAGTTIFAVLAEDHIIMSQAATSTNAAATATIGSRPNIGRTDLWIFKNVGGSIYGRVVQKYPGLVRVAGAALPAASKVVVIPPKVITIAQPLLAPIFDPQPGHENLVEGDMVISMQVVFPATQIRYTTDGTIPTATQGTLIYSTTGSYTLVAGDSVEIAAVAIAGADVSAVKRAVYHNVNTVPDDTLTATPDNASTGQARLDTGSEGGLMPTRLE